MRKKTSESVDGSAGSLLSDARLPADREQRRGVDRAGVEDEPGDLDARHVGDGHRDDAVLSGQRRHPEAEDDGVGALHADRLVDVVDARREDQVLTARQRVVDRLHAVGRLGDEEVLDRDRAAGRLAVRPRRARRVALHRGDVDVEVLVARRRRGTASRATPGSLRASCTAGSGTTAPVRPAHRRRPGSRRRCSSRRCCCSGRGTAAASH